MKREFRTSTVLFVSFMALAALVLCITAMHSSLTVSTTNTATGSATALSAHHELPSAQDSGAPGEVASCLGGPCGQDHFMMTTTCTVASLVSHIFMGTARATTAWRAVAHGIQNLSPRLGTAAPSVSPSLLVLSISRT